MTIWTTFLTQPAEYAEQGLCNGRASVHLSVCPIDRQQQRRPASLLLSAGVCSRYRSIAAVANAGSLLLIADEGDLFRWCYDCCVDFRRYTFTNFRVARYFRGLTRVSRKDTWKSVRLIMLIKSRLPMDWTRGNTIGVRVRRADRIQRNAFLSSTAMFVISILY